MTLVTSATSDPQIINNVSTLQIELDKQNVSNLISTIKYCSCMSIDLYVCGRIHFELTVDLKFAV